MIDIFDYIQKLFLCEAQCQHLLKISNLYFSLACMTISVIISIYNVRNHLNHYSNPYFQDKIIVILLMAPFYALTSYFSVLYPSLAHYLTLLRDVYEAVLLYAFFYLIFAYIGYDPVQDIIIDTKVYEVLIDYCEEVVQLPPFDLCSKPYKISDFAKAKYFVYRCKKMVLQFLVIKPGCALVLIIIQLTHDYIDLSTLESTLVWIVMISVSLSLYYLILFYKALKYPLAPYRPLMKFLIVKITLFFTFWQALFLIIFHEPILHNFDQNVPGFEGNKIILRIENCLVCFEMVCLTFATSIAFDYKEFERENNRTGTMGNVIEGLWANFLLDSRLIKPKKFGFTQNEAIISNIVEPKSYEYRGMIEIELHDKKSLTKHLIPAYI